MVSSDDEVKLAVAPCGSSEKNCWGWEGLKWCNGIMLHSLLLQYRRSTRALKTTKCDHPVPVVVLVCGEAIVISDSLRTTSLVSANARFTPPPPPIDLAIGKRYVSRYSWTQCSTPLNGMRSRECIRGKGSPTNRASDMIIRRVRTLWCRFSD